MQSEMAKAGVRKKKSARNGVERQAPALKNRLNRLRGQIDGVERMLDEGRYCVDIINQLKAVQSAIHGLEKQVLEGHLRTCVLSALGGKGAESKISEILELF